MLLFSQALLVRQGRLNGCLDGLDVLQARLSLKLVQTNALLEQSFHFCAHGMLAFELSPNHSFLLELHTLLLNHDCVSLILQVHQYVVLFLDLFFLVHSLLTESVLE